MTNRDEREAALEQLEEALQAEDGDTKNFHIREAIQLLHIEGKAVPANDDSANETVK